MIESAYSRYQYTLLSNNTRAIRIVELINNYRTRLLYTIEQTSSIYLSDAYQEGYLVLNQNREATLNLLRTSYKHSGATDNRGNEDAQTSHLRE